MSRVEVRINSVVFDRWKLITIGRSLNSMCGTFSMSAYYDYSVEGTSPFELSGDIKIYHIEDDKFFNSSLLGREEALVFTGYIDSVNTSMTNGGMNIEIAGRDITSDLVDCTVEHMEFEKEKAMDIITKLSSTAPYNLTVMPSTSAKANTVIERKNQPNDAKIADVISEVAKQVGVLVLTDEQGRLSIEDKASGTLNGTLSIGSEGNILSANHSANHTSRYSKITVLANSDTELISADTDGASKASKGSVHIPFPEFKRERYLSLVTTRGKDDEASLLKEAKWQMALSRASTISISLKTQGWRSNEGELWKINNLVSVDLEKLGLAKNSMLIKTVSFTIGEQGSFTNMELIHVDAYDDSEFSETDEDKNNVLGV